jgi:hypothetical protein
VATAGRDERLICARRAASFGFGRHVGARAALPWCPGSAPPKLQGLYALPPATAASYFEAINPPVPRPYSTSLVRQLSPASTLYVWLCPQSEHA